MIKEFFKAFVGAQDSWLGKDKALHAAAGLVIGSGVYFTTMDPTVAVGSVAVVALLKEVYDFVSKKGFASYKDFVATLAGGVIGCAAVDVVKYFML